MAGRSKVGRAVVQLVNRERFRELLIEQDMTLGELAEKTCYSRSHLTQLHGGHKLIASRRLAISVEQALGVPGELFGPVGTPRPATEVA